MNIFILDNLKDIKEEIIIDKPKNFNDLIKIIKEKSKNLPELYELFMLDKNKKEIIINNDEQYNNVGNILFVSEIDKDIDKLSLYEYNYNKLSESKQEILDDKYNCILCSIIIKNESPYLCYKCQKIFHEKCLKDWDNKCISQKKILSCPNCRNELPLDKWNKKLDYDNIRKDEANIINKINEYKLNNNLNNNINIIKDKKIEKYEMYIQNAFKIFRDILSKLNSINSLLKLDNTKLIDLLDKFKLNNDELVLELNNVSNIIEEELDKFQKYIKNNMNIENDKKKNNDNNKDSFGLLIKRVTGENFILNVNYSDTITKVKEKIQLKKGILPKNQKLCSKWGSETLKENKTIADYINRDYDQYLNLYVKGDNYQINIQYVDKLNFKLNIEPFNTIRDIKNKIQEKIKIDPDEQMLIFIKNEEELKDNATLGDYNIESSCTLLLYLRKNTYEIFVKTLYRTIVVDVEPFDTIEKIKDKIFEQEGHIPSSYILYFGGKRLEEYKTLEELNIVPKCCLHLLLKY